MKVHNTHLSQFLNISFSAEVVGSDVLIYFDRLNVEPVVLQK